MSEQANLLADKQTYTLNTIAGIDALQGWYNNKTGLWDSTGWWNSANCLTVLADFAALDPQPAININIPDIIQNTYEQARESFFRTLTSVLWVNFI